MKEKKKGHFSFLLGILSLAKMGLFVYDIILCGRVSSRGRQKNPIPPGRMYFSPEDLGKMPLFTGEKGKNFSRRWLTR